MNVFIVSSPFQYICANEARVFYRSKNSILILEINDSESGKKQLNDLVIASNWEHIIRLPKLSRSLVAPRLVKKLSILNNNKKFDMFFFAEYKSWIINIIKRNIDFNKHIYFDDGTATIIEYDEYIKNKKTFYRPRLLQDLLITLQGCKKIGKLEYNNSLEIFTIFNIKEPICKLNINYLSVLRNELSAKNTFDDKAPVGFIGQGDVGGKNNITETEYIDFMKKISKQHEKIIYFPHRTENESIIKKLMLLNNIIMHNSKSPIELELSRSKIKLSKIYGMASTALFTISIIYKEVPISIVKPLNNRVEDINIVSRYLTNHFK